MLANQTVFYCLLSVSLLLMHSAVVVGQEKNTLNQMPHAQRELVKLVNDMKLTSRKWRKIYAVAIILVTILFF